MRAWLVMAIFAACDQGEPPKPPAPSPPPVPDDPPLVAVLDGGGDVPRTLELGVWSDGEVRSHDHIEHWKTDRVATIVAEFCDQTASLPRYVDVWGVMDGESTWFYARCPDTLHVVWAHGYTIEDMLRPARDRYVRPELLVLATDVRRFALDLHSSTVVETKNTQFRGKLVVDHATNY